MTSRGSLNELFRSAATFPNPSMPLAGLRTALNAVEESLAYSCAQLPVRLRAKHESQGDRLHPDDRDLDLYELEVTVRQLLPRTFRGGYVLIVWSVFEAVVMKMADYAEGVRGRPAPAKKHWRGDFIEKMEKVSARIGIVAFPDSEVRRQLVEFRQVRKAITHYNSRLSELPESLRASNPEGYAALDLEVFTTTHEEFFVPTASFLNERLDLMDTYLSSLAERLYLHLHPDPLTDDDGDSPGS